MAKTQTIRNLLVRLGLDTDEKAAKSFDKAVSGVKKTLLAAAAAAAAAATAIFGFVKATAAAGDDAAKAAKRIGSTAEGVQELGFIADITGSSMAEIENSIKRMSRTVNDAENGLATASRTIDDLGVETKDANGDIRDSVDLFDDFIGALGQVESDVKRSALAQELFGRAGTRMLTMVDAGTASIEDMREMARDLGLVMSNEAAAASEQFNDSLVMLRGILTGLRNQIGLAFMPMLTGAAQRTQDWYLANSDIIKQGLEDTLDKIVSAIESGVNWLQQIWKQADKAAESFGGWDRVLTTVASVIGALAAMKAWGLIATVVKGIAAAFTLLSAKVVAIIAVFAALALGIQDVITYFRGGDSITGRLIERFQEWQGEAGALGGAFGSLIEDVQAFFGDLIEMAKEAWKPLSAIVDTVLNGLAPAFGPAMKAAKAFGTYFVQMLRINFAVTSAIFKAIASVVMWWWETAMLPLFEAIMPIVGPILGALFEAFAWTFEQAGAVLGFFADLFQGKFGSVGDWFESWASSIRSIFGKMIEWIADQINSVLGKFTDLRDKASSLPGLGFLGGDGPAAGAAAQQRQQAQQNTAMAASFGRTEIKVDASGSNASAEEIAAAAAEKQDDVFQKRLRQAAQTFFGGDV